MFWGEPMADKNFKAMIMAALLAAPFALWSGAGALAGEAGGAKVAPRAARGMDAGAAPATPVAPATSAVPAPPADIQGVWVTDDGLGAVEIAPCGEKRCGRIVWMKNPLDAKGKLQQDIHNPSAQLKKRPICGAEVITGLARQSDKSWDVGKIYDPKDGDDHDVAAKLKGSNELEVMGYEGSKWLSETFIWKRAPAELSRCDTPRASN
jgi:uncharacterized protein (DUF2147 family)